MPTSAEEAKAAGFSQEQIDEYIKKSKTTDPPGDTDAPADVDAKPKEQTTTGTDDKPKQPAEANASTAPSADTTTNSAKPSDAVSDDPKEVIKIFEQLDTLAKEPNRIRLKGDRRAIRQLEKHIQNDDASEFGRACQFHKLNPSSCPYGVYWDERDKQCYVGYCDDHSCTLAAWLKAMNAKACALYLINNP